MKSVYKIKKLPLILFTSWNCGVGISGSINEVNSFIFNFPQSDFFHQFDFIQVSLLGVGLDITPILGRIFPWFADIYGFYGC